MIDEKLLLSGLELEKEHYVAWMHAGRPGNQNAVIAINSIIEKVKAGDFSPSPSVPVGAFDTGRLIEEIKQVMAPDIEDFHNPTNNALRRLIQDIKDGRFSTFAAHESPLLSALRRIADMTDRDGNKIEMHLEELRGIARAALNTRPQRDGGWMPIETAPKDGKPFLILLEEEMLNSRIHAATFHLSKRLVVAEEIMNFGFAKPKPEDIWDPENEDWQWRMLVEWLADRLMSGSRLIGHSTNIEFISAISERDTNRLVQLAYELLEEPTNGN